MAAAAEQLSRERDRLAGPDELLETLYDAYRGDVQRNALRFVRTREDAEDVTQTTFLNAYRALARGKRPEHPRAWLLAIAQHVCCRRFQTKKHRPHEVGLDRELAVAGADDATPTAEDICSALQQLAPRERSALFMREFKGYAYSDIAARLGLSLSAVESLLFRARRSFREQLELADVTPCTAAVESRKRSLSGVLPWPAGFSKLLGWLGFSPARGGLSASAAAAIGAAVIAGGVAVEREAPPPAAPVMPLREQSAVREPAHARVALPATRPPTREAVAERLSPVPPTLREHSNRPSEEAARSARSSPEPRTASVPPAASLPQVPQVAAPTPPEAELPKVSPPEVEAPPLPSLPELPPLAAPEVTPPSLPALP
jgi:RNA polymerase sigma-70 factor, ECF subfamily